MSSPLNTIFSKILEVEDRKPLTFQSEQVNSQLQAIQIRFLGIERIKEIQLAILLQNVDLQKITNEELIFLSKLKMDYFGTRAFPLSPTKVLSKEKPLHDTGTTRLYSLINKEDLISSNINLSFSGLNTYYATSLKDLITSLYLMGA